LYAIEDLLRGPGFPEAFRRSLRPGGEPPLLRDLKIKLTSRCNLRCGMCRYWRTRSEDALDTKEWLRVLAEAAELGGRKVHFSGGEVFLRSDFLDLAAGAVSLGLKVNLTTNGTLVGREEAIRLAKIGVNAVSLSLDGPSPRLHDRVRGVPGAFRKTVAAVEAIRRYSEREGRPIRVRINFVAMRGTFRRLPDMVRLAGSLGAIDLVPMPVDERGERKLRLSRSQIEEYNRDIAPKVAELRAKLGFPLTPERIHPWGTTPAAIRSAKKGLYSGGLFGRQPCFAPWLHTFLAWDGRVYLCCMTNGRVEPLGDARTESLGAIFLGESYRATRARFLAGDLPSSCARCDLFLPENRLLAEVAGGAFPQPRE
jgi:MoaA/NifB/PqqE/SkfB family radical SAM enzyme